MGGTLHQKYVRSIAESHIANALVESSTEEVNSWDIIKLKSIGAGVKLESDCNIYDINFAIVEAQVKTVGELQAINVIAIQGCCWKSNDILSKSASIIIDAINLLFEQKQHWMRTEYKDIGIHFIGKVFEAISNLPNDSLIQLIAWDKRVIIVVMATDGCRTVRDCQCIYDYCRGDLCSIGKDVINRIPIKVDRFYFLGVRNDWKWTEHRVIYSHSSVSKCYPKISWPILINVKYICVLIGH